MKFDNIFNNKDLKMSEKRKKENVFLINYKYVRLIISLFIFAIIFFLFYIDLKTYIFPKNINIWGKIKFLSVWFSLWNVVYCTIICVILFVYEFIYLHKMPGKKIKLFYYHLKVSAATYSAFVFIIYNGLYLFDPKLITDDAHSLQSIIEHKLFPIIFNLYVLFNTKRYMHIDNDLKNRDIFWKVIIPSFIFPIVYSFYCEILKLNPYFFFDIHQVGIKIFIKFMFISFFAIFILLIIYSSPTLILINLNKYKQAKYIKNVKEIYVKK